MKMKNKVWLITIIIVLLAITGCPGDDPCSHNWSAWGGGTATCLTAGQETRTCSDCSATETRTQNALGTDACDFPANWTPVAPTCTEPSSRTRTCTVCPNVEHDPAYTPTPATAHDWTNGGVCVCGKPVHFTYISSKGGLCMAIDGNGNVWTWGQGGSGRLGHGNTNDRNIPTMITAPDFAGVTITAISAGNQHGMALDSTGNVWTWGAGLNGRLGHGNTNDRNIPAMITAPDFAGVTITAISAGNMHSMALDSTGNVWTWGAGGQGPLGHGNTAGLNVPTKITHADFAGVTITAISAGDEYSMALAGNGNVWTWGNGANGRLGHDTDLTDKLIPTMITHAAFAAVTITAISAGSRHNMALDSAGNVWTWGDGMNGRLGHGNNTTLNVPTSVTAPGFAEVEITSISAGNGHSMALAGNGNVWTWGGGSNGRLGHGNETTLNIPAMITDPAFAAVKITAISAGGDNSMALAGAGNVWTWGYGMNGRLGHGDLNNRLFPVRIEF